ncbi:MAG TPA: FtsX-like permease family protein [Paludibacteraceae bacterium]|nr:FtsX-like permease family protein [Paludibacteraceae bacterium]HPT42944.1 FtsX-like permease family protein [Paludibacteraceae bacterium]
MLKFLYKGLIRDRSRSLLPIIVVTLGVMITVVLQSYMTGVLGDSIETTANFTTGHVKVMTSAYSKNMSQFPNDLAIMDVDVLKKKLQTEFPDVEWSERVQFGGLLDVPDENGETRAQANVAGIGIDMLNSPREINRMNLRSNLTSGRFPDKQGELLISEELFRRMKLKQGDEVTLIASSMYGEMSMYNFRVCGTLKFGIPFLDRGTIIADFRDVQTALNMENATGELLGFFKNQFYDNNKAITMAETFNSGQKSGDKFTPVMLPLSEMNGMGYIVAYSENIQGIILLIFIIAMSIVLWNAGLIGGLRRYGEFGLRLAIGESKNEIYRAMIAEAFIIGMIGTIIGVISGLFISWLMQRYGLNIGEMMKDSTILMPTVLRSRITAASYYIGFIPGILSTVIGAMLAGIGIYKRQTANLFKELES